MSTNSINDTGYQTYQATAVALAANIRVKLGSDGLVSVAGATDDWIGVTLHPCVASAYVSVRLRTAPGTWRLTAGGSFSYGAALYPAASGKVDDASGTGPRLGLIAATEATADGDIIEAIPGNLFAYTLGYGTVTTVGATSPGYGFTQAQADSIPLALNNIMTRLAAAGF